MATYHSEFKEIHLFKVAAAGCFHLPFCSPRIVKNSCAWPCIGQVCRVTLWPFKSSPRKSPEVHPSCLEETLLFQDFGINPFNGLPSHNLGSVDNGSKWVPHVFLVFFIVLVTHVEFHLTMPPHRAFAGPDVLLTFWAGAFSQSMDHHGGGNSDRLRAVQGKH